MNEMNEERVQNEGNNNVSSIGNQFTIEQWDQSNQVNKKIIFKRRRLGVIAAVASIIFLVSGLNIFRSYHHIKELKKEKIAVQKQQAQLSEQVASLEYDVKLLNSDDYLAKVARQKFFYTKDDELVYSIPQTEEAMDKQAEKALRN